MQMTAIGRYRAPFAVYSAGHASNKGFSSTTGVHIALKRMNQVSLSTDKSTVEIGTGNGWADVYDKLDGTGVNVVGGRVKGPGVGGFTLGGGYSWCVLILQRCSSTGSILTEISGKPISTV